MYISKNTKLMVFLKQLHDICFVITKIITNNSNYTVKIQINYKTKNNEFCN